MCLSLGFERGFFLAGLLRWVCRSLASTDDLARPAFAFDFRFGRSAESMGCDAELLTQLAVTQDFYTVITVSKPCLAQHLRIDTGAVIEAVQRFEVHRNVTRRVAGIVKAALGDASDERHLSALEADANGTAGAGCLPLATAAGSFPVTA